MEQESLPPEVSEETLNEIYAHEIHETTNSYWMDWKERFE
jgi:hypothetical protein